ALAARRLEATIGPATDAVDQFARCRSRSSGSSGCVLERTSPPGVVNSRHASNAVAVCCSGCFCGSSALGWKETEVLAHLKLHAVDLREESGSRCAVIHRVGLGPAEMS